MQTSVLPNPKCQYRDRTCAAPTTHELLAPGGNTVPGRAFFCHEHGSEIVEEYIEKLGEAWGLVPLDSIYKQR